MHTSFDGEGYGWKGQVPIPFTYEGLKFDEGVRADLIVENKVIVAVKCVERLNNAHKKQLLTYLRLADRRLGYTCSIPARHS